MSGIFSAFCGRLGQDPEVKTIGKGECVVFNVAVKDYPEEVTWVRVRTTQLGLKDIVAKGSSVMVTGKQVVNKREEGGYWGPEVIAYDIQVIAGFKDKDGANAEKGGQATAEASKERKASAAKKAVEADIPF